MTAERVTVITLTYRRPDDLREAIPLLLDAISDHPSAELLVIDNDETPSAAETVGRLADPRVRYVHEPRPGIAAARNRGLDETRDSDVIVFIDDDERPQPGWLNALLELRRASGAEAVAGPVVSQFADELDPWIVAGGYFDRLRHPTGTSIPVAATNNLLLDRAFVDRTGLRFDEAFGLSGGSDSVFTRNLVRSGARILWCDEAAVVDVVPKSRANRDWVTRRAFRMGNTQARSRIHVATGTRVVAERLLAFGQGLGRVAVGGARYLRGKATRSQVDQSRGTRTFLRGAGMLLAAVGYKYFEYRRPKANPGSADGELRVLMSFRPPTRTTNPYIVQLFRVLRVTPGVAVSSFSWRRALLEHWDVFHLHWPETLWASPSALRRRAKQALVLLLILKIRLTRSAVVWTRHNLASHETQDPVAQFLINRFERATAWFVLLNDQSSAPRGARSTVIPHGHYVDWFADLVKSDRVPGRLACFGLIRPYKGMEDLLEAFEALADPASSLVIGGRPTDAPTAARLTGLARADTRVTLILRFLEDPELVRLVTEAELMVFPYLELHNSGAVLVALSLARPVLVPRNAVTEALRAEVGQEWVRFYEGPITPRALGEALAAVSGVGATGVPDLGRREWADAGQRHAEVYRSAVGAVRGA